MKMKFLLPACLALCASLNAQDNDQPVQLSSEQFRDFLLNGKTNTFDGKTKTINTQQELNINQNKNVWVLSESYMPNDKGETQCLKSIQKMKIINGMLLCYEDAIMKGAQNTVLDLPFRMLKEEHNTFFEHVFIETLFIYTLLGEQPLSKIGEQPLSKKLPYPNYPVIYRESSDKKLSFQYLTSLLRSTAKNINNSLYKANNQTLKLFNDEWNGFIKELMKETGNFPETLKKVMRICSEKNIEFDADPRKFKQDKEQLFYAMAWLYRTIIDSNFSEYLKTVPKLDEDLTKTFNANRSEKITNAEEKRLRYIHKCLTCTNNATEENWEVKLKTRNFTAKALILSVLTHMDTAQASAILEGRNFDENTKFLCKSYGTMAKFIKHLIEHKHVHWEGEDIPIVPEKSYIVLKKGVSLEQFYDDIYYTLVHESDKYKINNVNIRKSMSEGIEIDIELTEDQKKKVITNMVSSNGIDRAEATNILRLVIKEHDGVFELSSIYPIKTDKKTEIGTETAEDIHTMMGMYFMPDDIRARVKSREIKTFKVLSELSCTQKFKR